MALTISVQVVLSDDDCHWTFPKLPVNVKLALVASAHTVCAEAVPAIGLIFNVFI